MKMGETLTMENEEIDMEEIINEIFKERVEKIKNTLKFDDIELEKEKLNEKEIQFKIAINNIPPAFKETRRNIIDKFIEYTQTLNEQHQQYYEKYYKKGVLDGIKLINSVLR